MSNRKTILTVILCQILGLMLAGCTSTGTDTLISDQTIKGLTEAVGKLDKEQVRKLEEAIKEKLKYEKEVVEQPKETTHEEGVKEEVSSCLESDNEPVAVDDKDLVSALKWNNKGDPHHIVQCYFGHGHDSELFRMVAALPIDFTCDLGNGISITKPASDDTACMNSYGSDHMQARRAFACFFDANGNLTACEDFANTLTFDSRWKGRGEVKGLIVHCKQGNAVSRTALMEVK